MSTMNKKEKMLSLGLGDQFTYRVVDGLLEITKNIDNYGFKNVYSSYAEILKRYFSKDEVFVLSRIKDSKGIKRLFDCIFDSSYEKGKIEMNSFIPHFLIIRNDFRLLLKIEQGKLTIYELPEKTSDIFIFRGYKYKKANLLKNI